MTAHNLVLTIGLTACLGSFSSCKNPSESDRIIREANHKPYLIDLPASLNNWTDLFLSEIIDSILYTALETTEASVLSPYSKVISGEKGFLIASHRNPLYYFDSLGRFVHRIGTRGKGPGEYLSCMNSQYHHESKTVYVFDGIQGKILRFNLIGELMQTIPYSPGSTGYHMFNPNCFVGNSFDYDEGIRNGQLFCQDSLGKIQESIYSRINQLPAGGGTPALGFIPYGRNSVVIPSDFGDTLYQVNQDFNLTAFCYFNLGEKRIPESILSLLGKPLFNEDEYSPYIISINTKIFPTGQFVGFQYQKKSYNGIYRNKSGSFQLINNMDQQMYGIINDLDGGPSLQRGLTSTFHFNVAYQLLQPIELIQLKEDGYFENRKYINKKGNQRFLEMLDTLQIEDNPIIMTLFFKPSLTP